MHNVKLALIKHSAYYSSVIDNALILIGAVCPPAELQKLKGV